ncbi:hypothetical protein C2845_PM01G14800 [Panicum miliaceum]|uniref:Uncharacterized protein n=1 Tax=Panicum miliaceum TaxID=4540 RepID=A0A3L6TPL4_PANMI|nr:hypothetical protein C2845_PM01G14800 [Panicum miliaceum]
MDRRRNTKDGNPRPCIVEDARRHRRERERFLSASMTDEQREEKNRKRREAYKRNKCQSQNKENDPVKFNTSNPNTNAADVCIIADNPEHTTGPSLLDRESNRVLAPLSSIDGSIDINKTRSGANHKNKDGKQIKSISAEQVAPINVAPAINHDLAGQNAAHINFTPTVIEHPTTLPFNEHSPESIPEDMVKAKLSDA